MNLLAGRPVKASARQKVKVQVPDSLSPVPVAVDHDAEAFFRKAELPRQLPRHLIDMAHKPAVFTSEIQDSGDVSSRNDEEVMGGLGGKVFYDYHLVVLVPDAGWTLPAGDAAEDALVCHRGSGLTLVRMRSICFDSSPGLNGLTRKALAPTSLP